MKQCKKNGYKIIEFKSSDIIPVDAIFLNSMTTSDLSIIDPRISTYFTFMVPLRHFKIKTFQKDKVKRQQLVYHPLLD